MTVGSLVLLAVMAGVAVALMVVWLLQGAAGQLV